MACFSPSWASLITNCTPCRPRAFSERRNAVHNAPSSLSPIGEAEYLPPPVGAHPGGHHHGLGDHPTVDPGLAVSRVEEHVRVGRVGEAAVAEHGDLGVQVRADPAHLACGDPRVGTQRADQVVDLAGGDPVQASPPSPPRTAPGPPAGAAPGSEGKNDPARSFGIRNSTSPAGVVNVRGRCPFRYPCRSGVRSCGAALIAADNSASINACQNRLSRLPDPITDRAIVNTCGSRSFRWLSRRSPRTPTRQGAPRACRW